MKNYYEILEIPYSASQQEIQKAYKKLSAKYHPDINGGVSFFNQVYQQIQDAYNVLSNESHKAEYDRSNNISNQGNSYHTQTEKQEAIPNPSNQKIKTKDKKSVSYKALIILLITGFILATGYFVYERFQADIIDDDELVGENEEMDENILAFNSESSNEENLRKLLEAENLRDYDVIKTFYSGDLERYWNSHNINFEGLKAHYIKAWEISSNSRNNLIKIEKIDRNILHVTTEFSFTNARTNKTNTSISLNKYVFNNYGLITQVFNINPVKEYDEYRDNDFSFISNEEKIRRLLKAEDIRDFNKIASFYSAEVDRYWNAEHIKISDLEKEYNLAWRNTSSSYNNIMDIHEVGFNTYQLRTRFYFETSDNEIEMRISENIYVFNRDGLITEVYGVSSI
ncbi:MAG: DnaJ domain-containing protein [Gillisia sp.]